MGKTYRKIPFHRELGEAMDISPARRARETRETYQALKDFIFGDMNEQSTAPKDNHSYPLNKRSAA